MTTTEEIRERAEGLTKPLDPDVRMDAYYYGFDHTGTELIDGILSAVAGAGKSYHNTEDWCDSTYGPSCVEQIQTAAERAASVIRAVSADLAYLLGRIEALGEKSADYDAGILAADMEVDRYRAVVDAARKIVKSFQSEAISVFRAKMKALESALPVLNGGDGE